MFFFYFIHFTPRALDADADADVNGDEDVDNDDDATAVDEWRSYN